MFIGVHGCWSFCVCVCVCVILWHTFFTLPKFSRPTHRSHTHLWTTELFNWSTSSQKPEPLTINIYDLSETLVYWQQIVRLVRLSSKYELISQGVRWVLVFTTVMGLTQILTICLPIFPPFIMEQNASAKQWGQTLQFLWSSTSDMECKKKKKY